jgi:drug/metabolite transporter (DMT)-like permease
MVPLLLLSPVIWGATFPAAKIVLGSLDVLQFMAWSRTLGLVTLALPVLLVPRLRRQLTREALLPGAVLGVVLSASLFAESTGLRQTTATNAGFITGLYVVFVPLLSALVLRARVGAAVWLAAVLATSGLALLSLGGLEVRRGDLWVLLGAVVVAVHFLLVQRFAARVPPLPLGVCQMLAASLLQLALAAPGGLDPSHAAHVWRPLVVTGVLGSGVAFALQLVAQSEVSATRAALLLGAESLFAALFSALWLGERLTGRQWLGAALVVAAMVLSELRARAGPVVDPYGAA